MSTMSHNLEFAIERLRSLEISHTYRDLYDQVVSAFALNPDAKHVSIKVFAKEPYLRAVADDRLCASPGSMVGKMKYISEGVDYRTGNYGTFGEFLIFRDEETCVQYEEEQDKLKKREARRQAREARRSAKRTIRNSRVKKASLIGGSVLLSHFAYYYLPMGGYISAALAFGRAMFFLP